MQRTTVWRGMLWGLPIKRVVEGQVINNCFLARNRRLSLPAKHTKLVIFQVLALSSVTVGLNFPPWGVMEHIGQAAPAPWQLPSCPSPQAHRGGPVNLGPVQAPGPLWVPQAQLYNRENTQTGEGWPVFQSDWLSGLNKQLNVWGLI